MLDNYIAMGKCMSQILLLSTCTAILSSICMQSFVQFNIILVCRVYSQTSMHGTER